MECLVLIMYISTVCLVELTEGLGKTERNCNNLFHDIIVH